MKFKKQFWLILLSTSLLTAPVFAEGFVDKIKSFFGGTSVVQNSSNKTQIGDVTSNTVVGDTNVKQGDVKVEGTTNNFETKDILTIKSFVGTTDNTLLFGPIVNASTKQIENTNQIFKEFKEVLKEVNKSNQDLLKAQAEESRKFTEQLVKQVIGSPPTIPIVSASSSFPINYPTNSITTPFYIKDIDSITNFNNLITNLPNMSIPIGGGSVSVITQTAHGFAVGNWVYLSAASTYALADADLAASADTVGVVTSVPTANTFTIETEGYVTGLSGLTAATRYYLSQTAGAVTSTAPSSNIKAVFISDTTTSGYVQQYAVSGNYTTLGYGRVNASADLASIAYSTTAPGTAINFNNTVYSSQVTFSGTNGIIPSTAGRYRVSWFAMAGSGEFNADGTFHVVQNGTSLGSVFVDIMQAAGVNQLAPFIDVNLAAGQAVTLNYQPAATDSVPWGKGSYFQITQLSGFAASTGTTVDYIRAQKTTNQTAITVATDITFQSQTGNIPFDGTNFTLSSGKTYELQAFLTNTNASGNSAQFQWVNSSNVALSSQNVGMTKSPTGANSGGVYVPAHVIYTPSSDETVHVRVIDVSGTMGIAGVISGTDNGTSFAVIKQIGSTNNTVGTLPASDQSSSGFFDIGNMRMQWGTHSDGNVDTTTVTMPAAFANTNYSVVATSNTSAGSLAAESKTTTTFDIDRASTTTTTQTYSWIAIGQK